MPLQNRVTPFGDIVAIEQRGLFMGNRGIIHDPATRTLLRRRWTNKAWIICACEFRGVRREPMRRRSWTELFFFDEAIALAAGHRPCFFCRRAAAMAFAAAWATARRMRHASARADRFRPARASACAARKRGFTHCAQRHAHSPDGATVVLSGEPYVMADGRAFRWTPHGYETPRLLADADGVLTPPSTVAALRAGFSCVLHPTLRAQLDGNGRHARPQPSDVPDRRPPSDCL